MATEASQAASFLVIQPSTFQAGGKITPKNNRQRLAAAGAKHKLFAIRKNTRTPARDCRGAENDLSPEGPQP